MDQELIANFTLASAAHAGLRLDGDAADRPLADFLFSCLPIDRTINSPFGEALKSIRENERWAISRRSAVVDKILSETVARFAVSLKVFARAVLTFRRGVIGEIAHYFQPSF